jgi:hypothetical protein
MKHNKTFVFLIASCLVLVICSCDAGLLITGIEIASYPNKLFYVIGIDNELDLEGGTVHLLTKDNPNYFYDILPFAYVLGLSDVLSKTLEQFNMPAPHWYYSDGEAFSAASLIDDLDSSFSIFAKKLQIKSRYTSGGSNLSASDGDDGDDCDDCDDCDDGDGEGGDGGGGR